MQNANNNSLMIVAEASKGAVYYNKLLRVQINHPVVTPVDPSLLSIELASGNYYIKPDKETAHLMKGLNMRYRIGDGYVEVAFSGSGTRGTDSDGDYMEIVPQPDLVAPLILRFIVQLQKPTLDVLNTGTNLYDPVNLPLIKKKGFVTVLRNEVPIQPANVLNDDSQVLYKEVELEKALDDEDRIVITSNTTITIEHGAGFMPVETVKLINEDDKTKREIQVKRTDVNTLKFQMDLGALTPGPYQLLVVNQSLTQEVYVDVHNELSNAGALIQIEALTDIGHQNNVLYNEKYYLMEADTATKPNWYYLYKYNAF